MTSNDILFDYQTLSGLMGDMLRAARHGDWDRLVEIEADCQAPIGRLKASTSIRLSPDEQQQKLAIIKKILRDDAAIRDLTQPRLAFLQQQIGLARTGRQSVQAYR